LRIGTLWGITAGISLPQTCYQEYLSILPDRYAANNMTVKMKIIKENHRGLSTILALALIPLGGLATDIYIPSLPAMSTQFHVSNSAIQLSLIIFMISSGISQLFIGGILDSFGRFRISLVSLAVFAAASFIIALSKDIMLVYAMRIVQGITVSLIIVGKRAYFVDIYSGDRLKGYTSMFSIIWATAPVVAPFIGGYLQESFGWSSNFYFLGALALNFFILEYSFSGESLKNYQPFKFTAIRSVYGSMLGTWDFTLGLFIIGLSYSLLVIYGMASPFIIERIFGFSPVMTGYSSLLSGLSLMTGGIISKMLINTNFVKKVFAGILLQVMVAVSMLITSFYYSNIFSLIAFTILLHMLSGFIFNNVYSYCLSRFTHNAGTASGLTGGGVYIVSSFFSYGLISFLKIKNPVLLATANLCLVGTLLLVFIVFVRIQKPPKI
jgi:DHA1 family bicyclomycin/chloramphenicol resistance-like MFS transporter